MSAPRLSSTPRERSSPIIAPTDLRLDLVFRGIGRLIGRSGRVEASSWQVLRASFLAEGGVFAGGVCDTRGSVAAVTRTAHRPIAVDCFIGACSGKDLGQASACGWRLAKTGADH